MEIIKQPEKRIVKDPIYEIECSEVFYPRHEGCGAVFRFRKSESVHISDQRDGDADYVVCPCCGRTIWKNNFNWKEVKE